MASVIGLHHQVKLNALARMDILKKEKSVPKGIVKGASLANLVIA